jgi:hypothetical protein
MKGSGGARRFLITRASFVDLLGGSVMGPVEDRVMESVRLFEDLLERGLVQPPAPAR